MTLSGSEADALAKAVVADSRRRWEAMSRWQRTRAYWRGSWWLAKHRMHHVQSALREIRCRCGVPDD